MSLSTAAIAQVAHEANRALQIIQADPGIDPSPYWDHLDEETQISVIEGVEGVLDGLTPEQSHKAWCVFKLQYGWVYGATKDLEAKTHPCLVPYSKLPAEQRLKDDLFAVIVHALSRTD